MTEQTTIEMLAERYLVDPDDYQLVNMLSKMHTPVPPAGPALERSRWTALFEGYQFARREGMDDYDASRAVLDIYLGHLLPGCTD